MGPLGHWFRVEDRPNVVFDLGLADNVHFLGYVFKETGDLPRYGIRPVVYPEIIEIVSRGTTDGETKV